MSDHLEGNYIQMCFGMYGSITPSDIAQPEMHYQKHCLCKQAFLKIWMPNRQYCCFSVLLQCEDRLYLHRQLC